MSFQPPSVSNERIGVAESADESIARPRGTERVADEESLPGPLSHSSSNARRRPSSKFVTTQSAREAIPEDLPSTPDPLAKFDTDYPPPPEPTTEFDRRYPSDRFGEEVKDDARVWKIYRDETSSEDRSMLDGWNKTLDVLLIFAGLFSAVSTAFIIESYKLLQPDYTQYLAEAVFTTLASSNGSELLDLTRMKLSLPSATTPDPSSRWVNGLWFVSLGLSLSVALLCILAKQWLDEYHACTTAPASSPRHWTRRHVQYKEGLVLWHVPAFISVLPAVLHASLFLFLAGLYVFLGTLDGAVAAALLAIAAPLLVFYLSSIAIPMFAEHCPWSTALVAQILRLSHFMHRKGISLFYLGRERLEYFLTCPSFEWIRYKRRQPRATPARSVHQAIPSGDATPLSAIEGKALEWLITSSPSSDIVLVAAGAIGSLHPLGDTISYLRASKASVIAARIALNLHRMEWGTRFGAITHARMRRLGLMLLDVAYDYRWSFAELHSPDQHHYDLPVLAGLRPTGSYPPIHHGPRAFDLMPYEEMSTAYVQQIEAVMKRASCSVAVESDAPQPFLPSTVMLLLLHIPSVPLLVHAYHIYRMVWRDDVLSTKFVAQCLRRSLIAHNIQPTACGGCEGCVLTRLELWCQVLDYSETWALDDDDRVVLEEDIRWLARSRQWNADECPFGVAHSLDHLPHALDVCASGKHSRPDVSISVLRTGMRIVQDPGSYPDGPGLWNPAAARSLVNVIVSLRQYSMGVLPAELAFDLEFLLEDNPIGYLFDGICRGGYIPAHRYEGDQHPPYPWNVLCPVPCGWAYSADWDDPTCFLRPWDGQPSPWRIMHDLRAAKLDLLLVGDVLAAQLCALRRRGREDPNLLAEFFVFDSCMPYLRRICLHACKAEPEDDQGRIPFFAPLEDPRDRRAMILRFVQHCTELRGADWWINGLSAFCATSPEALVGEVETAQHETLKPRHEIARIVRECRDFFVDLDREVGLRGRCRDCPLSADDGLASAGRRLARWKPLRR